MIDAIDIIPFNANEWTHKQTPKPDMPQFMDDSVVDTAGWRLELGNVLPDGNGVLAFPLFLKTSAAAPPLRFRVVVQTVSTAAGRSIEGEASWYLDDLRPHESDLTFLNKTARAIRSLVQATSKGAWDIERLKFMERLHDI